MAELLGIHFCVQRVADTAVPDPIHGAKRIHEDANGPRLPSGFDFAREQVAAALRAWADFEDPAMQATAFRVSKDHRGACDVRGNTRNRSVKNNSDVHIDIDMAIQSADAQPGALRRLSQPPLQRQGRRRGDEQKTSARRMGNRTRICVERPIEACQRDCDAAF